MRHVLPSDTKKYQPLCKFFFTLHANFLYKIIQCCSRVYEFTQKFMEDKLTRGSAVKTNRMFSANIEKCIKINLLSPRVKVRLLTLVRIKGLHYYPLLKRMIKILYPSEYSFRVYCYSLNIHKAKKQNCMPSKSDS